MHNSNTGIRPLKALIAFRETGETDNLFVPILCDAIHTASIDVKSSLREFWDSEETYDIIHFQWPEEVVGWNSNDPDIIDRLKERILFFRSHGAHFIYTRHNVRPHDSNDIIGKAYDLIETESDIVVHMSEYSRKEFETKYPNSRNVVIPHHVYEYTYKEDISIERARQYLNLPQGAFIVTVLDPFRNSDEARMTLSAFHQWKAECKLLLAPHLYPFSRKDKYEGKIFKKWLSRMGYYIAMPLINRWLKVRGGARDEQIDDCDLPYYIAASDVIFIPKKEGLNAESLSLAFLFHKITVGPYIGNIGEILLDTGNPVFDPNNRGDIIHTLNEARQMAIWYKGEENYTYAMEHMSVKIVGAKYAELYKSWTKDCKNR